MAAGLAAGLLNAYAALVGACYERRPMGNARSRTKNGNGSQHAQNGGLGGTKTVAPTGVSEAEVLEVFGARTHNLHVDYLAIPKRKYVVFTGVSGSGKSSMAFDTLYAEGQRRY